MKDFLTAGKQRSHMESIGRLCAPYSLMLLLFTLDITAVPAPFDVFLSPPFMLMALYYWAIFRPSVFPLWLAFLTGLALDLIGGFPLGLNALLYSVVHMVLTNQRRLLMVQGFMVLWLGFVLFDGAVYGLQWVGMSLFSMKLLPLKTLVTPFTMGALCFPLISALLRLTHKIL